MAAALGGTGLGAGASAVFVTTNGTGTAALIAVGLLLTLVALAGRIPSRGSFAGVEYDLGERIVERAFEELPLEARQQVAALAVEEALSWPSPTVQHVAQRVLWREEVMEAIRRAVPAGATLETEAVVGDRRYDAAIIFGSATVVIELISKQKLRSRGEMLSVILGALPTAAHALMWVAPELPTPSLPGLVVWTSPDDDSALAQAIFSRLDVQ